MTAAEAGAKVTGRNGRKANIRRVGTDAATKMKTNMKAIHQCRRIHPHHLRGLIIAGMTRRSANTAKILRGSTTKEKRTNTNTKKEREQSAMLLVRVRVDHHLRQMQIQYLQLHLEPMNWQNH